MLKRVTQKDVAEMAGVSRAVVSHVLHGGKGSIGVSGQTSERVRLAAAKLGYRPSAIARILKGRRTRQIAVVHGDGFQRLYFSDGSGYFALLMDGFAEAAFRHGYTISLCPELLSDDPEDAMADARFDGLLWYSTVPSETSKKRLADCSLPVVIMHAHLLDFESKYDTVICDNEGGIGLAVDHLTGLGHQSILFAYDSYYLYGEARIRFSAFLDYGRNKGLAFEALDVRRDGPGLESVFDNENRPTAVLAYNDELASRVVALLKMLNLKVPQDVSVVGFDSTRFCQYQTPPLTSVSQPLWEMGEYAVEMLVRRIEGDDAAASEKVFACGLDVRESTGLTLSDQKPYNLA